ncbi:MAG TPA: transcriptional repressor LexA [Burkholderiales bacterium]|jgi:repressor LexA|nr:transcriptional repressor LexA [Burkholderiales bacterium]
MDELTARQAEVLQLIADFLQATGFPPTRAEIAAQLGFRSPNAAEDHLRALERKGYIEMLPGASRGIRLRENLGIPVVGRVAAGSPILAEQHIQGRYQLDPALFKPRADYLLKVRGLSMRDVGILDGDLLAVHRTSEARSGQIVVARLGNEVTVKRFKRQGNQVQLLPENPDFEPILVDLKRDFFAIEGLGVGIIRNGKTL